MTLNDLPNRPNIRITKSPMFVHGTINNDTNGNLLLKSVVNVVSTYSNYNSLPYIDDDHVYYFYSIDDDKIRYAEVELSSMEKRMLRMVLRKEKLQNLESFS